MMVGAVIALLLILLLMYLPNLSLLALLIIFLGLGFITSTQIVSYPLIAESNPLALTGTAEGMGFRLDYVGGYATSICTTKWNGNGPHQIVNHVLLFLSSDYQFALAIMLLAFILGLVMAYLSRETYCISYKERQIQR
ncbi:hypothetical protein [Coxiella-like endosymbiont]|uniref:hypothetical protein n=1 Tax=Coxiella-like endosymbiont TaxID=1592897 RepID=UPI00272AD087|nr:hypothetical protein [Coxiella-like endosymbiont]